MVKNAFAGQRDLPTEEQLTVELGAAKPVWDRLLAELADEQGLATRDWNSYSVKAGWALRLKKGDRNIAYLSPGRGEFMVSFALGDRAVHAARESNLPKQVLDIIATARRYAEGTAVRLDIRTMKDLPAVKKLAAIKQSH
jgi:hypothetical protein